MRRALWALILLSSAPALADVGTSETRLLARDLATQGANAYDRGAYDEALDLFHRAGTMLNAPTISLMEGRCLVHLGRWKEALDRFHLTGHSELPPDAPPPFAVAVQDALKEAQELELKIPHLKLVADPKLLESEHASVTIDGNPVPAVLFNVAQPINPGEHQVRAAAEDKEYFVTSVTLQPLQSIDLSLPAPPPKVVAAPPAPVVVEPVAPAPPATDTSQPPAWLLPVGIGAAAVGGVTALVTGILGNSTRATLNRTCTQVGNSHECEPSQSDRVSRLALERGVFIGGLALGAVGIGLTTYALVNTPMAEVKVAVSPDSISLRGRF